ncbi:S-adenosyl-L-methionine-dependent methyltransferases superfamily protein [Arabidopsis thaliana]|uniref:carnosine N-methyltransferase n=1 Tax=Arabidopsis thaliana TaxID=3702 RepID=F4IST0_ARATH|nr:S-adenosyl-L-methionine-dependent methyltransferases superfamily protein [Arabidopsis thaliana]AEC08642.1 S-adenosyl-L-methionine-dependent methyltransferases superfamily protein [Arabidopsis thaliana]|eukprot:NP_180775.2 S-adenosyl-L-methionine-dependent methyltransferases superfamily protein [Arabidopsis thaliana]
MISSSEMMATEKAPEFVTAMATETERIGNSREVDEEKISRKKNPEEEALEAKCLPGIISAYLNYPKAAEENLKKCERSYQKLSPAHKALVTHFPMKLQRLRRCILMNSHFIYNMLQAFEPPIDLSKHMREPITGALSMEELQREEHHHDHSLKNAEIRLNNKTCEFDGGHLNHDHGSAHVPLVDVNKVRWVIRNIVRDWGAEGQRERDECYKPILEELDSLFPDRHKESTRPACLVPGAGLGRLALEISCLGFRSQGNEVSYYMMLCSSFILNYTQLPGEWTIYPWIHTNCNSLSDDDQLRPISIPDIHPASAGVTESFSMCRGDFVEVFNESSQAGMWDAVVTCFFIDTAHNIIEYIETISKILKDGGVLINLGPLLYHFADEQGLENEMSIELSLEDVKRVASHYGFEMEKEKTIETTYSTNPRSMMKNRYYPVFWTMRKKCAITTT